MRFVVTCKAPRLLALLAVHGICDVCLIPFVLVYTLCLRPKWSSTLTTTLFAIASVYHFAQDAGWLESIAGHTLVTSLYLLNPEDSHAFEWMLAYTCIGHIPLFATRLYDADCLIELTVLCIVSLTAFVFPLRVLQDLRLVDAADARTVHVTDEHQRIVVMHILCRLLASMV